MIHIDIKRLARIEGVGHRITGKRGGWHRGVGYEFVHVCIDDRSRVTYAEILADQGAASAAAFLRRAVAWYLMHGVVVKRVMTDNGGCYISDAFAEATKALQLKHVRTRPYTPQTNGKAERLIQTLLREWAYHFPFRTSAARCQMLKPYLHFYNHHRLHSALDGLPPISRLSLNNVLRRDN
jgi:transposase InsO family protein